MTGADSHLRSADMCTMCTPRPLSAALFSRGAHACDDLSATKCASPRKQRLSPASLEGEGEGEEGSSLDASLSKRPRAVGMAFGYCVCSGCIDRIDR